MLRWLSSAPAAHTLVFVDRLLAVLVHLWHATSRDVVAAWFGGERCTSHQCFGPARSFPLSGLLGVSGQEPEDTAERAL